MFRTGIAVLILSLHSVFGFSQLSHKADSLTKCVARNGNDTTQVKDLVALAHELSRTRPEDSRGYAQTALDLARSLKFHRGEINAEQELALFFYGKNNFSEAISHYRNSYSLCLQYDERKEIGDAWNCIALCMVKKNEHDSAQLYIDKVFAFCTETPDEKLRAANFNVLALLKEAKGQFPEAVKAQLQSISILEKIGNKDGLARSYTNISDLYNNMKRYDLTIEYAFKALALKRSSGDTRGMGASYNTLGTAFKNIKQFEKSKLYYDSSLVIKQEINDRKGIANTLNNLGNLYTQLKQPQKALDYYFQSMAIKLEMKDAKGLANTYNNIGLRYIDLKDVKNATMYLEKGLAQSILAKGMTERRQAYGGLANVYTLVKDYKKANEYLTAYLDLNDSILNTEATQQIAEMQTKYDTEKKQREIELQSVKITQNETEINRQRVLNYSIGGGLLLVIALAFFIYRGYRTKKKANEIILQQKEEVEKQRNIISDKKQEIQDSINYAKQIQQAMLPDPLEILRVFPQCFGLYRPKDVVSGDFYWFAETENTAMIAAADCTGHGVPGAFMSMVGADKLNQAVLEQKLNSPAAILSSLNKGVKTALRQNDQSSRSRDGMDIALCAFNKQRTRVVFSGANRPMYLIRDGAITEYPGTKSPIGGSTSNEQEYKEHTVDLLKNDLIFIFSDGFADQFGGPKGKKFMTSNFKEMLVSLQHLSMEEMENELELKLQDWKGTLEQVDDILVIGIRM